MALASIILDPAAEANPASTMGIAILLSGNTSVVVTHEYSGTPGFVIAIPNQNMGNVWITNIGDTTFTINTSVSTGTNTTFCWLTEE